MRYGLRMSERAGLALVGWRDTHGCQTRRHGSALNEPIRLSLTHLPFLLAVVLESGVLEPVEPRAANLHQRLPDCVLRPAELPRAKSFGMLIEVTTDNHIQGRADVAASVQTIVDGGLEHFRERLSRVEVHLADENGDKGGDSDIRCSLEARIEGMRPVGVSHYAGSLEEAVVGATEKLGHLLEHTLGRLESKRPKLDGSAAEVADLAGE